jgi:hypothetical protein
LFYTLGLVEKTTKQRRKKSGKHCGEARMLTVEEIQTKAEEREVREAVEAEEKARKRALYGKVGFAKLVLKELSMGAEIFE